MSSSNPFGSLFGKSPLSALQRHMRVVLECAREIPPLFEALAAGDQDRVMSAKTRIFEQNTYYEKDDLEIRKGGRGRPYQE